MCVCVCVCFILHHTFRYSSSFCHAFHSTSYFQAVLMLLLCISFHIRLTFSVSVVFHSLLQVNTLKSNFVQVEAFLYFPTKAALCMTDFTTDKSKMDKSNFGYTKLVFLFSHVCFIFECPQSPYVAAGHRQALQHKPCRQAAFVCYCFGQCL